MFHFCKSKWPITGGNSSYHTTWQASTIHSSTLMLKPHETRGLVWCHLQLTVPPPLIELAPVCPSWPGPIFPAYFRDPVHKTNPARGLQPVSLLASLFTVKKHLDCVFTGLYIALTSKCEPPVLEQGETSQTWPREETAVLASALVECWHCVPCGVKKRGSL